jgi:hypothetical protein
MTACDCMPDGQPGGLRAKFAARGRLVSVTGATEHVGDGCRWRVTAECDETTETRVDADVAVAYRESVEALLRVLAGAVT